MNQLPEQTESGTAPPNLVDLQEVRTRRITSGTALPQRERLLQQPSPPSSTSPARLSDEPLFSAIQATIQKIAARAKNEFFEDGVDNELSRAIEPLLHDYGSIVIDALSELYHTRLLNAEMASEILPWLGRAEVKDSLDHQVRFWFLVYSLRDDHAAIRSGAALGLASLEDPRAALYLRRQAELETIELLRSRLIKAAEQLSS